MRPALLHLDDALRAQHGVVDRAGARAVDARSLGPALRLWSRPGPLSALRRRLAECRYDAQTPDVVLTGSGDFHHVSLMLIERAIEGAETDAVVLHFDNHPDWVKFERGLHCGSWAARAARLKGVSRLITVGPCSADIERPREKGADLSAVEAGRIELYPYRLPRGREGVEICGKRWPSIESLGRDEFTRLLLSRIEEDAVYVTIDKDVLAPGSAATNWDQGAMDLGFLLGVLARVRERHRIIGADIVGDWSPPRYGPGLGEIVLKRGEALFDQPWRQPDIAAAIDLNERANLSLLDVFAEGRAC